MKKLRIIIDVMMYIFFIILMGHHITENLIHEILGTGIIILFVLHNIININSSNRISGKIWNCYRQNENNIVKCLA